MHILFHKKKIPPTIPGKHVFMLIIIIEHVCDIYAENIKTTRAKNCYKIDMKQNMEP